LHLEAASDTVPKKRCKGCETWSVLPDPVIQSQSIAWAFYKKTGAGNADVKPVGSVCFYCDRTAASYRPMGFSKKVVIEKVEHDDEHKKKFLRKRMGVVRATKARKLRRLSDEACSVECSSDSDE
jgi:hypothetical protein